MPHAKTNSALLLYASYKWLMCVIVTICAHTCATAQAAPDSAQATAADEPVSRIHKNGDSVTSFKQWALPEEVLERIRQISPEGILLFHDEYQVTQDIDERGEVLVTIRLWYVDDHLKGFVFERADRDNIPMRKYQVDIPVEWCCIPYIYGDSVHDQHCVKSIELLRASTALNHCRGWHIKLPDEDYIKPEQLRFAHEKPTKKKKKKGNPQNEEATPSPGTQP